MPIRSLPIEERVRKYAELGLTQRQIAPRVRRSQSTVSRIIHKIDTGPHPILRPGDESPARPARLLHMTIPWHRLRATRPGIRVAFAVLALALAGLTGFLIGDGPAGISQVTACVRTSADSTITGIAAPGRDGSCPPQWETVVLPAGS